MVNVPYYYLAALYGYYFYNLSFFKAVMPRLDGYGNTIVTYIHRTEILRVCTQSNNIVRESEYESTVAIYIPTEKGIST